LSKLHVKSFGCKQFSYSAMRRELCIAEVSTQGDTPLVVATSHLESPCPGPPKWDQMFSKERVKQANEAVDFLKKNPNAIFCGDMNWDDLMGYGEFPLALMVDFLRDFKVESINMVGTERIPEVTYMKQRKGKPDLELPVLPSDHFGLLLTMAAR
ncbi:endonuclease/exonuclease/phosphatase family protein, partial [Tanacetum coccineum]